MFRRDLFKSIAAFFAAPLTLKKAIAAEQEISQNTHSISTPETSNYTPNFDELEYEYRIERLTHAVQDLDAFMMTALQRCGYLIAEIQNPSECLQLIAINHNGMNLQYIKNPTQQACEQAVIKNGQALQYVKAEQQNDLMQQRSVKKDGTFIRYAVNPSEETQLIAINKSPNAIGYIENPTEKAIYAAAKSPNAFKKNWHKVPKSMQADLLKKHPRLIQFAKDATDEMKMDVLKTHGMYLRWIKKPTEEMKWEAIKSYPPAIRFIEGVPSQEMQLYVLNRNPGCIIYINTPCKEAIQFVKKHNIHHGPFGWECGGKGYITTDMANFDPKEYEHVYIELDRT